jgi:leader peptidase (prepilin peptidase)/N-methyltransferase
MGDSALSALLVVVYIAVLLISSVTDLRSRRIPNLLTLPALAFALFVAFTEGTLALAMVGALIGAGAFMLPMFLYGRGSAGAGDVKLAAFLGAALGLPGIISALFFAGLAASVVVLIGIGARKITRRSAIPFGPFIAFGGLAALYIA